MSHRQILAIVTVIIAIIIAVLGSIFFITARDVKTGPVIRSIIPSITTVGHPVEVSLAITTDDLPKCNTQQRAIDAFLIIDVSSSMDGTALNEGGKAAITFADELQHSSGESRVGVIIFNDTASVLSPLGAPLDKIKNDISGLRANGGTNIASAFQQVNNLLDSEVNSDSLPVVILLSDGGTSDFSRALNEANKLKTKGVYLVAVAIQGGGYDPDVLRQLASTSADVYNITNLPEISELYRHLAHSLTTLVATDVFVYQPYAESFELIQQDKLPSSVNISAGSLEWMLPILTSGGATLTYMLEPNSIGWHDISSDEGQLSLVTCLGKSSDIVLASGPKIFVSPIPPILWLIIPLILFLVWLIMLWRKRDKKKYDTGGRAESLLDFDFRVKPLPLTSLDETRSLSTPSSQQHSRNSYPDALIIGLGRSGEQILGELRRQLVDQEGTMPDNIRLLTICAQWEGKRCTSSTGSIDEQNPTVLAPEEQLILKPDLDRVAEKLHRKEGVWTHLDWWGENTPDDPGRAGARMALFYDLMEGLGQSKVWTSLTRRLNGLSQPLVYVVASLALYDESGMALDLPHFIKQAAKEIGDGTGRVMTLFFLQRTGASTLAESDTALNTYAAIRELQRLLLREPWYYAYNPNIGLIGSTDTTPVDACYLLDGLGENIDMSHIDESEGFYPTVADSLLTFLTSDVATWHQDYVNQLPAMAQDTENLIGYPTVSTFGCSTIQYPIAGLKKVIKAKFLIDLLYGGLRGQKSLGIARLSIGNVKPSLDTQNSLDGLTPRDYAIRFLRDGGRPNRHPLMHFVAKIVEGETVEEEMLRRLVPADKRIDNAFRYALRDELYILLNGNSGDVIRNRTGKLGASKAFLESLMEILEEAEHNTTAYVAVTKQLYLRTDVVERISNWRATVRNTLKSVLAWEIIFVGDSGAEPKTNRRYRRSRYHKTDSREKTADSFYTILTNRLDNAQKQLAKADSPPLRKLIDWDKEQQEVLYQRYLGDEMLKQDERGIKPLENMIARIGWSVKVVDHEDIIQIRLVIFPPQVAANSDIVEDNKYTFSPKQSKEIFDNLEQLAEYYLSYLNSERFSEHLSVMGFDNVVNELIKGEKPLAKYHSEKIAESATETRKHLILSVKGDDIRSQIEHRITRNPDITSSVAGKSNADPYRCTLIGLTDIVPFFTLDAIEEAKLDYASDPLAHVFHAEQQATMLEREWYTRRGDRYLFHPRFVRLLENESLIRELALAFLYGLLEIETIGIKKQAYLRYELSGKSREIKILQSEQIDIFDIFNQSFNSWLQSPPENPFNRKKWPSIQSELSIAIRNEQNKYKDVYSYLETIEEEILDRLDIDNISQHTARQAQRRPWKKDVDVYLWLLIEEEKNYILEDWE